MAWSTNASGGGGRGVDVAAARFGGGVAVGGGGLVGGGVADGPCVWVRVMVAVAVAVAVLVGVGVCGANDVASSMAASVRPAAAVASTAVAVAKLAVCWSNLMK